MTTKLSKASAIISTIVSTLGTGILYMPASFKLLGYVYGAAALALVGFLTFFTLYALAYAAVMTECKQNASYPRVASLFSKTLKTTIDVAMICSNVGCCVCILRFFCKNAAAMLALLGVGADPELLRRLALGLVVVTVAYFGSKENLDSLAFISKISLAGVVYYLCLVAYYAAAFGHRLSSLDATSSSYGSGFIKVVFAMHCQFSFLSIFSQLDDKSEGSIRRVCAAASALIACTYALAGMLGYIAVGNEIGTRHVLEVLADGKSAFVHNILVGTFDKRGALPAVAVALFLFVWFGSLVFMSHPVISIAHSYAQRLHKRISRRGVSYALALFLFCLGLPPSLSIGSLLDISGALFTAPISFGYPSLFMLFVAKRRSAGAVLSCLAILFTALLASRIVYTTLAAA